eukprot:GGOE01001446.1.p1 GENE.GGOE01001446.1~~GGOE01001446.1.p1  ORF type:complete len:1426 (-),score=509.98 GGOE01001446.1:91-4368(-)
MADNQAAMVRALHEFKGACTTTAQRAQPTVFRDKFWELCILYIRRVVTTETLRRQVQQGCASSVPRAYYIVRDALWCCGLQCADQRDRYTEFSGMVQEEMVLKKPPAIPDEPVGPARPDDLPLTDYTLFQEANEGYAKLLVELMEVHLNRRNRQFRLQDLLAKVQCLVGHFKLDPHRVGALMVDAFEGEMDNPRYIRLLKTHQVVPVASVLGFQFRYYWAAERDASGAIGLVRKDDAKSLYHMTAMLLRTEVVTVADVYPHLQPSDKEMAEQQRKYISSKVAEAKRWGSINLREDAPTRTLTQGSDLPSDIPTPKFLSEENQKFNLVIALLAAESFDVALDLLTLLGPIDPMAYPPLFHEACARIEALMEPLYGAISNCPLMEGTPPAPSPTKEEQMRFGKYAFPLIHCCGTHLRNDVELLTKLCRIIRSLLNTESGREMDVGHLIEKVAVSVLFPCIAIMVPLPSLCYELWDVLKLMPFEQRFRIYGRFQAEGYNPPHFRLILAKLHATKETSNMCKRIAKESTKPFGRSLAKVAHCNPLVAFEKIIEQAMAYENLIPCLVEMVRYITPLAMDMVVYQTLVEMATPDKLRMKDATTYSNWLTHLGTFAGMYFRKYHHSLDLQPMLYYILRKLRSGETSDLVVIQELMKQMTGLETMETNVTDAQLQAHAGGSTLRFMAGGQAQTLAGVNLKMIGKASKRLRDRLVWGGLAAPMLLLLAQLRTSHLFEHPPDEGEGKLQRVSDAQDEATNTLSLMLQFLTQCHPKEPKDPNAAKDKEGDVDADVPEVRLALPKLAVMVSEFGIDLEVAFALCRPTLKERPIWKEADVREQLGEVLGPGLPRLPASDVLPRALYFVFWTMDLYDILVPKDRYEDALTKLRQEIADQEGRSKYSDQPTSRRDVSAVLKEDLNSLTLEYKDQVQSNQAVQSRLHDFRDSNPIEVDSRGYDRIIWDFLQECVLPRCTLSMLDAIYCGEFLKLIHQLRLQANLLLMTHQIISFAPTWLAFLTECEAQRVGKFLAIVLEMLLKWRVNSFLYEKECLSHPGFRDNPNNVKSVISFKTYKQVHFRMHEKLTKAFLRCLSSSEVFERRNCLLVLGLLKDVYPQHERFGRLLLDRMAVLRDQPALKALAESCEALLLHKKYNSDMEFEDEREWAKSELKPERHSSPSPTTSSRPSESFRKREREPESEPAKRPREETRPASPAPKPKVELKPTSPVTAIKKEEERKASPVTAKPVATTTSITGKPVIILQEEGKKEEVPRDVKPVPKDAVAPVAKKVASPTTSAAVATTSEAKPAAAAVVKKEGDAKPVAKPTAKPATTGAKPAATTTAKPSAAAKPAGTVPAKPAGTPTAAGKLAATGAAKAGAAKPAAPVAVKPGVVPKQTAAKPAANASSAKKAAEESAKRKPEVESIDKDPKKPKPAPIVL